MCTVYQKIIHPFNNDTSMCTVYQKIIHWFNNNTAMCMVYQKIIHRGRQASVMEGLWGGGGAEAGGNKSWRIQKLFFPC